ncbi:MAG: 3-phosphoshikimate 1-carboxyvinyltransferase, partial [Candidatus Micrarchaeia archaeon]
GARIQRSKNALQVVGVGGKLKQPTTRNAINVGNAGAVLRLLLATCSLLEKCSFTTNNWKSLGTRPNRDLLTALSQLGVKSTSRHGRLPITVYGGPKRLHGGKIKVSGETSSQYVSALLFLSPLIGEKTDIKVTGNLKSRPAVKTTLDVMKKLGVNVKASKNLTNFELKPQKYKTGKFEVPGDFPSAAALLCAAAVTKSNVTLKRMFESKQGESKVVDVLKKMGANISYNKKKGLVQIKGGKQLKCVTFDGDEATDAVLAMVAASVFAKGKSRFYNIENIRFKESDRIFDFCKELKKTGANVSPKKSEIIIRGKPEGVKGGCTINAHHDHRIIMALTIVGLRAKKTITIKNIEHVAKSYPNFFTDMKKLGAKIKLSK